MKASESPKQRGRPTTPSAMCLFMAGLHTHQRPVAAGLVVGDHSRASPYSRRLLTPRGSCRFPVDVVPRERLVDVVSSARSHTSTGFSREIGAGGLPSLGAYSRLMSRRDGYPRSPIAHARLPFWAIVGWSCSWRQRRLRAAAGGPVTFHHGCTSPHSSEEGPWGLPSARRSTNTGMGSAARPPRSPVLERPHPSAGCPFVTACGSPFSSRAKSWSTSMTAVYATTRPLR
jgi:hypothetical protein